MCILLIYICMFILHCTVQKKINKIHFVLFWTSDLLRVKSAV